jgi:hypothetical protein
MIPINDTDDKNTRGIFPDIVKVVVVMVIIFKFNILLCIHVCVFKAYILANNRHFFLISKLSWYNKYKDHYIKFFDVSISTSEYEFYLFKDSDVSSLEILLYYYVMFFILA